jgi:hypothetical protein
MSIGWVGAQLASNDALAIDYTEPVPGSEKLTVYQNNSHVLVRWNNMPLTAYRAHITQKHPYFYPVNGPVSGVSLTSESALPYPHHRGLWLGCQPLNGGDYWNAAGTLAGGQIRSAELKLGETTANSAVILNRCNWVCKDAPSPLRGERKFAICVLNERMWFVDCWFKLTAQQDIIITKAKHSFFAMRAASDISPTYGGVLMNSEGGIGAAGTYGKEAKWCGYHGRRAVRPDVVEGIAIMTHPDNPWRPIWFTRDYGHMSPSPFNFLDKPWQLEKGKSILLKYRVVLHAGSPAEAQLNRLYEQWAG